MVTRTTKTTKADKPAKGPKDKAAPIGMFTIPITQISASIWNSRESFDDADIETLADTIKREGLLVPLMVRPKDEKWVTDLRMGMVPEAARFELLDGERRYHACNLVGLREVRCEVRQATDAQARSIVLLSCLQRRDLSAVEQARGMQAMLNNGDCKTVTALAKQMGIAQGTASNRMRLLELPDYVQDMIISQEMTERHGRALLALNGSGQDLAKYHDAIDWFDKHRGCSVEDFETAIQAIGSGKKPAAAAKQQQGLLEDDDEQLLGDIQDIYDNDDLNPMPKELDVMRKALYEECRVSDATRKQLLAIRAKYTPDASTQPPACESDNGDCDQDCSTCNYFGACEKPQSNPAAGKAAKAPGKPRIGDDHAAGEDLDEEIALLKFQKDLDKLRKHAAKIAETYPEEYKFRDELVDALRTLAKQLKMPRL